MAIALVGHGHAGSTNTNGFTTGAFDTTGANFIIVAYTAGTATSQTLTDSKGNTWHPLPADTANSKQCRLYYAYNATVGTGHTFTITGTATNASLSIMWFSGVLSTSDPYGGDITNNGATGTSMSAKALRPTETNCLLVTATSDTSTSITPTIDAGYTVADSILAVGAQHDAAHSAYLIQTSIATVNPTWTFGGSSDWLNTTHAWFKSSSGTAEATGGIGVRKFDGVNDEVHSALGNLASAATIPETWIIAYRLPTNGAGEIVAQSAYTGLDLWIDSATMPSFYDYTENSAMSQSGTSVKADVANGFVIVAFTRSANGTVMRWHQAVFSAGSWGAFTHQAGGSGTAATQAYAATGTIIWGNFAPLQVDIALAARCSSALSDAAIDALVASGVSNLSAWSGLANLTNLWRFDGVGGASAVNDLVGTSAFSSITGTTLVSSNAFPIIDDAGGATATPAAVATVLATPSVTTSAGSTPTPGTAAVVLAVPAPTATGATISYATPDVARLTLDAIRPNVSGVVSITKTDIGSVANVTSETSSVLTTDTVAPVGTTIILRIASNNSGSSGAAPTMSVSDSAGNTYTLRTSGLADPGAANAGVATWTYTAPVTTQLPVGGTITMTYGTATTAKAAQAECWTGLRNASIVAVAESAITGTNPGTAPAATITPTASGQLVYVHLAAEGIAGDTFTGDSDTTAGSWAALTAQASADATRTNNVYTKGQYKIVTGTTTQNWAATITSADFAGDIIVFDFEPQIVHANAYISSPARLTMAVPAPTAVAAVDATATPAAVATVLTTPSVTTSAGSTPTPAVTLMVLATPAVTASGGSSTIATPAAVATVVTTPSVTTSAGSSPTPAAVAMVLTLPPSWASPPGLSDEFIGSSINTARWTVYNRLGDQVNGEVNAVIPANIRVTGGSLFIDSKFEDVLAGDTTTAAPNPRTVHYTSGQIAQASPSFLYGTVEVRAKICGGIGTWPCFWMLSYDWQAHQPNSANELPGSSFYAEIDFAEFMSGHRTQVNCQIHWDPGTGQVNPGGEVALPFDATTRFMVYRLQWSAGSAIFSVDAEDGNGFQTIQTITGSGNVPNVPMYVILHTAIGGIGGGTPDSSTYPVSTEIDYVHITPAQIDATATPSAAAMVLTTPALTTSAGSTPTPAITAMVLATPALTTSAGSTPTPAAAALVLTTPQATPSTAIIAAPAAAALVLTTPSPNAQGHVTTAPAAAALVLTTPQVNAQGHGNAAPAAVITALTTPSVALSAGSTSTPAAAALIVATPAPVLSASSTALPAVAALVLTTPSLTMSAGSSPTPAAAALILAAPTPTLLAGAIAAPAATALILTTPSVSAFAGTSVSPAATALVLITPQAILAASSTAAVAVAIMVLGAPAPTAQSAATPTPAAVLMVLTTPAVSETASGGAVPSATALVLTTPQATATASSAGTALPGVAMLALTAPPVTLSASAVSPLSVVALVLAVASPSTSATGNAVPSAAPLVLDVPSPNAGGSVTSAPSGVGLVLSSPAPATLTAAVPTPAAVAMVLTIPAPHVFVGILPELFGRKVTIFSDGHRTTIISRGYRSTIGTKRYRATIREQT